MRGCFASPPPCYPGVSCVDLSSGSVQCGACPPGTVGDGRQCRPGITCLQRPCFRTVQCFDTAEGFQCGPCPDGYALFQAFYPFLFPYHLITLDIYSIFATITKPWGINSKLFDISHRYEGDGQRCVQEERRRYCDSNPCFSGRYIHVRGIPKSHYQWKVELKLHTKYQQEYSATKEMELFDVAHAHEGNHEITNILLL